MNGLRLTPLSEPLALAAEPVQVGKAVAAAEARGLGPATSARRVISCDWRVRKYMSFLFCKTLSGMNLMAFRGD
jgi:hypothetical protein